MANTCPECGASMEFEQHNVRLRTGACPACAKEFAFVEGAQVSTRLGGPAAEAADDGEQEGRASAAVPGGPECEECGSPLTFREGHRGSIEATCDECETTTVYVPKPEHPRPERGRPSQFDDEGPRGRPCRRCGAPLRFSTGEDGLLVGECAACGNRFTLPPRPDRRGQNRGFTGPRRYGRSDFRRGPGSFDDRRRPSKRRRPRDE